MHTVHELLSVLAQPSEEMRTLRHLLTQQDGFPSRRTWERRLKTIPDTLPAQIGCLGRHLLELIQPWATCGRAVAIDSTVLRSRGVWHQKHREQGEIPHTSIDTDARLSQIGLARLGLWLEVACRFGRSFRLVSIAAVLTPANVADSEPAPELLRELPADVRFVLGDRHYNTPDQHQLCQ